MHTPVASIDVLVSVGDDRWHRRRSRIAQRSSADGVTVFEHDLAVDRRRYAGDDDLRATQASRSASRHVEQDGDSRGSFVRG